MLYIENLKGNSVRNLAAFDIELANKLNFFYGSNGSGKTSILEAIYLLSMVKSFRSSRIHDVISYGADKLQVFAKGINKNRFFTTGIEKGNKITRLRSEGIPIRSASEQAKKIPIYILTSEYHFLFTGTPKERRHWLDWSLFHVEQDYLSIWKSYHRALRHRNALLRSERDIYSDEMVGWENIMEDESRKIDSMRNQYISNINTLMNSVYLPVVMAGKAQIDYENNRYRSKGLGRILAENREEDAKRGFTSLGPHRSDILFFYEDFHVARYLSRGQTKLYRAALISAQITNLKEHEIHGLVLVDDLDAELDEESAKKIVNLLLMNEVQTFVSSLIKQNWIPKDEQHAVFHVKQGNIQKE